MNDGIVVFDPRGEVPDGQLIRGDELQVKTLRSKGVVILPVDPDRAFEAADGYYRRGWGSGWAVTMNAGQRACPMLIGATNDSAWIYWTAIVTQVGTADPSGSLRLSNDTARAGLMSGGIGVADGVNLGAADWRNRGSVHAFYGKSKLNVPSDGVIALTLWAVARNSLVMVSAVTTTRREVQFP